MIYYSGFDLVTKKEKIIQKDIDDDIQPKDFYIINKFFKVEKDIVLKQNDCDFPPFLDRKIIFYSVKENVDDFKKYSFYNKHKNSIIKYITFRKRFLKENSAFFEKMNLRKIRIF